MRRPVGLLLAACALGASAFLIPDGIIPSVDEDDSTNILQIQPPINPKSQEIRIPCFSCRSDGVAGYTSHVPADRSDENGLVLGFTVSDDGERLLLNDETIYPLQYSLGADLLHQIHVPQVPWSSSTEVYEVDESEAIKLEVTGSMITVEEPIATEDGALVIPLSFTITEIQHKPVVVDSVSVKMVKTAEAGLSIVQLTNLPNPINLPLWQPVEEDEDVLSPHLSLVKPEEHDDMSPLPPHFSSEECNVFCRFKATLGTKVESWKQGKGADCEQSKFGLQRHRLPSHIRPHFLRPIPDGEPRRHWGHPHRTRPHGPYHHHRPHHHHHNRYRFLHAFARGVAGILIPTLAGVAVGMAVSMFGLCVGRCIGFTWFRLVRGGRRGYASACLEEGSYDKELVDPLPIYEEAPAYEEKEEEAPAYEEVVAERL